MKISLNKSTDTLVFTLRRGLSVRTIQIGSDIECQLNSAEEVLEVHFHSISKLGSPWLTLKAAAKYLNKSERTLLRWIHAGKIKPVQVGRQYRFLPEDLKKWVKE